MKKTIVIALLLGASLNWGCAETEEPEVNNIILMIGDGMGLAQITALAIYQDYEPLNLERSEYVGIQKTYSANNRVTDSAAAGTALATGEKTNNGMVAVNPQGETLESSLHAARLLGKATAIVVTCSPTAATPAVFYAHHDNRRQEEDIALQIPGSGIDIIAGSGRMFFEQRKDGRNLIEELKEAGYAYAPDKHAFLTTHTIPVVMLTDEYVMPYCIRDSTALRGDYLAEATAKALELLDKSGKNGFFMMVEGSLIDYAGHDNDIEAVLGEMHDFDKAVKVAFDYAESHPGTLVIVTGDHETGGLTITPKSDDYTSTDTGIDYHFSTGMHSGTFIPIFAHGTGANHFTGVMVNTEIAKRVKQLMR